MPNSSGHTTSADPEFGQALRQAVDAGVEAYAYTCTVSLDEVRLADPLESAALALASATDEHSVDLMQVYHRLYDEYGPQHWWPADSQLEVVLGAILTQSAAWGNVEKALACLKEAECRSAEALRDVSEEQLAELVRSSGYFNAKARKLKAFISHLWEQHWGRPTGDAIPGKEQACGRNCSPSMASARRLPTTSCCMRESTPFSSWTPTPAAYWTGWASRPDARTYAGYQQLFHQSVPTDAPLYNEYHALLDRHAKEVCRKTLPACQSCCPARHVRHGT